MTIDVKGLSVDYIDQGEGPVVLLLHGWAAPIEAYRRIVDKLSARYRVLVPQMPGSGKTPEPSQAMTLEDYGAFVLDFCQAVKVEECIFMGHSNGGRIILHLLSQENCPLRCKKVVLMDAAGVPPVRPASYYVKVYSYKLARKLANMPVLKLIFGPLYQNMSRNRGSEDYRNASPVMKKTLVNLVNLDLTPLMPKVRQNTLLIWGENDGHPFAGWKDHGGKTAGERSGRHQERGAFSVPGQLASVFRCAGRFFVGEEKERMEDGKDGSFSGSGEIFVGEPAQ